MLGATLEHLCHTVNRDLTLRFFEMRLLNEAGYRPQLYQCVSCQKTLEPEVNSFSSDSGGMLCPECAANHPSSQPVSINVQKILRLLQNSDYGTVERLKIDTALSRELESIVSNYLRHLLERDVKSAAWLDMLREQTK